MKYFTSDLHIWHKNILIHESRPFKDCHHMHMKFITNFNVVLNNDDDLYILGDITLLSSQYIRKVMNVLNKINGYKHLILGNHDSWKARSYLANGFTSLHSELNLSFGGYNFRLCHDPTIYISSGNFQDVILCGHVHSLFDNLFPELAIINVGVDVQNFKPISEIDIISLVQKHLNPTI